MTEREILLKKISTYQFSILDLQIFLDTHPYDQQVLSQIKECKEKLLPLIEEYEEKYGQEEAAFRSADAPLTAW